MMTSRIVSSTIQQWQNSLVVRIPANIARHIHFQVGTPVEIFLQEVGITIKPIGQRKLTLEERLELFDPNKHGGEE